MTSLIDQFRPQIQEFCRRYEVARLELFGSAAGDTFDPARSDVDLLVEFLDTPRMSRADQYFGLLFAMEDLLHRKVDLVSAKEMRNPYFIRSVEATKKLLYAA